MCSIAFAFICDSFNQWGKTLQSGSKLPPWQCFFLGSLMVSMRNSCTFPQQNWIQGCPGETHALYHPHNQGNSPGGVICRKWVILRGIAFSSIYIGFSSLYNKWGLNSAFFSSSVDFLVILKFNSYLLCSILIVT